MLATSSAAAAPLNPWLEGVVARVERDLASAACLGGLDVPACQVRLVAIVDAAADFARIADSTLRGLDAPTDPAERDRFRAAFRERLLSLWKRRLHGEPRVELRLVEGAAERPRLTVRRGGETFEVELTVATTADGPRIVDVAIDGAGLVATWRPRIAHTLERAGWAEVLERLGDR